MFGCSHGLTSKKLPNLALVDVQTGTKKVLNTDITKTSAIAVSPDGKYIASAQSKPANRVDIWDPSGNKLHTINFNDRSPSTLAFSPDGGKLIVGGGGGPRTPLLQVIEVPSWKASDFGRFHRSEIRGVSYFPGGKLLGVDYLRTGSATRCSSRSAFALATTTALVPRSVV